MISPLQLHILKLMCPSKNIGCLSHLREYLKVLPPIFKHLLPIFFSYFSKGNQLKLHLLVTVKVHCTHNTSEIGSNLKVYTDSGM